MEVFRRMGTTFVRFAKRRCASLVYNAYTETKQPTGLVVSPSFRLILQGGRVFETYLKVAGMILPLGQ